MPIGTDNPASLHVRWHGQAAVWTGSCGLQGCWGLTRCWGSGLCYLPASAAVGYAVSGGLGRCVFDDLLEIVGRRARAVSGDLGGGGEEGDRGRREAPGRSAGSAGRERAGSMALGLSKKEPWSEAERSRPGGSRPMVLRGVGSACMGWPGWRLATEEEVAPQGYHPDRAVSASWRGYTRYPST